MPFINSAARIVGELDAASSPTVMIEFVVNGRSTPMLCHIDTGCADDIVFSSFAAAVSLGVQLRTASRAPREERILANGSRVLFVSGRCTVSWFGLRSVMVLAPEPPQLAVTPGDEEPDRVLIGMPLLIGTTIRLGAAGDVEITA